jgi:molecular chaperone GrpE
MPLPDRENEPAGVDSGAVDVDTIGVDETPPAADAPPDTDTDTDDETEAEAETIANEISELAAERDQFRDIAQRLQADFENYRRRVASQSAAEAERATGRLAEALLPVLDATEAAFVRHPDEVGPLLNLMLAELRKQGLETLDLHEQPFDPTLAEAVAHESGDGGEVVVAEVLRSGYRWKGKTLRPAMVRTRD